MRCEPFIYRPESQRQRGFVASLSRQRINCHMTIIINSSVEQATHILHSQPSMANCQARDDNKYLGIYVRRARTSGQDLGVLANHFVCRRTWRTETYMETETRQGCDSECCVHQLMILCLRIQHMSRPVLSRGFKLPT